MALPIGTIAAGRIRPAGRLAGGAAHRHLFRHDYVGVRADGVFPGELAAVRLHRRRERVAGRAGTAGFGRQLRSTARAADVLAARGVLLGGLHHRTPHRCIRHSAWCCAHQGEHGARRAWSAIRCRQYKLAVFVIAALYAGLAGGLLGVFQSYMPPDAFSLDTSGELVVQTVIGGVGTLIGPTVGAAIWLWLRDNLQAIPGVGALWKLILGVVFVVLVIGLRRGIAGEIRYLLSRGGARRPPGVPEEGGLADRAAAPARADLPMTAPLVVTRPAAPALRRDRRCQTLRRLARRGWRVVRGAAGSIQAVIGPNGAGKSTLFKMLKDEITPDRAARCGCSAEALPAWAPPAPRSSASAKATSSTSCSWS